MEPQAAEDPGRKREGLSEQPDLGELVAEVRTWPKLLSPIQPAGASSRISSLEGEYPQVHIRHGLELMILQAEEGIRAASELTGNGRARFPFAVYPLARSALELAAGAYWILAASTQEARVARFCAFEIKELDYHIQRGVDLGLPVGRHEDDKKALKEALEKATGEKHMPVPGYGALTAQLGKRSTHSNSREGRWLDIKWGFLSALTHGSSWARTMHTTAEVSEAGEPREITQHNRLADSSLLCAAWAVKQVHALYTELSGVSMNDRLPPLDGAVVSQTCT